MMSPAVVPSLWSQFRSALFVRTRAADAVPAPEADADPIAAQRAFVNEALLSNPDAFSSGLDICEMMQFFPGKF